MLGKGIGRRSSKANAAELLSAAGSTIQPKGVEQLEARQLMFALSASPYLTDLASFGPTGAGQAGGSISFNYFVPEVRRQINQFQAGVAVNQNFDADYRTLDGIVQPAGPLFPNNTVAPVLITSGFNFRAVDGSTTGTFVQVRHSGYDAAAAALSPNFVTGQSTTTGSQFFTGLSDDQQFNFRLPTGTQTSVGNFRAIGLSSIRQFQFTTPNFVATEDFQATADAARYPTLPLANGRDLDPLTQRQATAPGSNFRFGYTQAIAVGTQPALVASLNQGGSGGGGGTELATRIGPGISSASISFVQSTDITTLPPNNAVPQLGGTGDNVYNEIARQMTRFRFRTPGFSSTADLNNVNNAPRDVVAGGEVFDQSFLFLAGNGAFGAGTQPQFAVPTTMNASGFELSAALQAANSISVGFKTGLATTDLSRVMTAFSLRNNFVNGGGALEVQFGIELRYRGTVVQTFSQAQLQAAQLASGVINLARATGFDEVRIIRGTGATSQVRVDDFTSSGRGQLDPTTEIQLFRDGNQVSTVTAANLAAGAVATPRPGAQNLIPGTEYSFDFAAGFDEVRFVHNAAGGLAGSGIIIDDIRAQSQGALDAGTVVELLQQGRVIDTFTAAELNTNTATPTPPNPAQVANGVTPNIVLGQIGRVEIAGALPGPGDRIDENLSTFRYSIGRRDDVNTPTNESAVGTFDQIRIRRDGAVGTDDAGVIIDDVSALQPPGRFNSFNQARVRTAQVTFSGLDNDIFGGAGDPVTANNGRLRGASAIETFGPNVANGILTADSLLLTPNTTRLNINLAGYVPAARPTIAASDETNSLQGTLDGAQTLSFSFLDERGNARPLINFAFTTTPGGTLDDGTQVELLRNGRVVRLYTPAEIAGAAVQFANPDPTAPISQVFLFDTTTNASDQDVDSAFSEFDIGFEQAILNLGAAFDTVRISRVGAAGTDANGIDIDRVTGYTPALTEFFDLYGRPVYPTARVTAATGVLPYMLGDKQDDGVPDFNDGIGRIVLSNTQTPRSLVGQVAAVGNNTSNLTIYGAVPVAYDEPTDAFGFTIPNSRLGNFSEMEGNDRFGYFIRNTNDENGVVFGLPLGTGSVVIGSPFVRDNRDPILYHGINPGAPIAIALPSSFPVQRGIGGAFAARTGGGFFDENFNNAGPGPAPQQLIAGPPFRRIPVNFSGQPIENQLVNNPLVLTPFGFLVPNAAPDPAQFQGIFSADGQSVGDITVHGIVHGNSRIGGSARRFAVGYLPGSVQVDGDVGLFSVASDAGAVYIEDFATGTDDGPGQNLPLEATGSRITISGAVRQMQFGARNLATVSVLNDTRNPNISHLDFVRYAELEQILGIQPGNNIEAGFNNASLNAPLGGGRAAVPYGNGAYRNDTLAGAEYIGSAISNVVVNGSIGALDAISPQDITDIYAFSANAGQRVTVSAAFFPPPASTQASLERAVVRIVNGAGRVVASNQYSFLSPGRTPQTPVSVRLNFTPSTTDVYYIVLVTDPPAQGAAPRNPELTYQLSVAGLATTGVGSYKSGANTQALLDFRGDVGSIRFGAGFVNEAGLDISPANIVTQTVEDDATFRGFRNTTINAGGVNTFISGTITNGNLNFSGNLRNVLINGDLRGTTFNIGGSVGTFRVTGAIAGDSISANAPAPAAPVVISTGTAGGPGNIGEFFVDAFIVGTRFTLNTSDRSTIGRFVTPRVAIGAPRINMGIGSDIRFADIGQITVGFENNSPPVADAFRIIPFDQTYSITDDSGAIYRLKIDGGAAGAAASFLRILQLPVQGSQGVAIARVEATLAGGASLRITGETAGVVSIGRIVVAGGDPRTSTISLGGNAEIDVFRIEGGNLNAINNSTRGGDIVLADVASVNTVSIQFGNLGFTQDLLNANRQGVELGLALVDALAAGAPVGSPIQIPLNVLSDLIGDGMAGVEIPLVVDPNQQANQDATLEDIGAPIHSIIGGLVVRSGSVQRIAVSGAIGDVLLQDPAGNLISLTANTDAITAPGSFDGLRGVIQANNIGTIDVGDGLVGYGDGPFVDAGIFAAGTITRINGGKRYAGVTIRGLIIGTGGIASIDLENGLFDGAFIAASTWDSFWYSARFTNRPQLDVRDAPIDTGTINNILGTNSAMFRTTVFGTTINNVQLRGAGGIFDASTIDARGLVGIGTVSAASYRNSTIGGESLEYVQSQILSAANIASVSAVGDIQDLYIDAQGSVTRSISARNFTRLRTQIDGTTARITTVNDVRSSEIVTGRLTNFTIGGDLRSTTVNVAGRVDSLTVRGDATNVSITSFGPDGRINKLTVGGDLTGLVSSDGPITTLTAGGDIRGTVRTTDPQDGNVGTIRAGGDLASSILINGNATSITAAGSIGRQPVVGSADRDMVVITGNLATYSAGGQIYAFTRVNGSVTGTIAIGRVVALPGSDLVSTSTFDVFGSIAGFNINGDFNGTIISHSGGIGSIRITNGSFRRGSDVANPNRIEVRDGNLGTLTITNGSLFGNVLAIDGSIGTITVTGTGFGDIGINPDRSNATATGDGFRNQLPPGVATSAGLDGPTISATLDVGTVNASGGVFESSILAGRNVNTVTVGANGIRNDAATGAAVFGSVIGAGDRVNAVNVTGPAAGLRVIGGLTSLGTDGLAGGTGAGTDTIKSGSVGNLNFRGGTTNVTVSAGVDAGADGLYNTVDDTAAAGLSTVGLVTVTGGAAVNTTVSADTAFGTVSAGVVTTRVSAQSDPRVYTGATAGAGITAITTGVPFDALVGVDIATIRFTGAGQARAAYDAVNRRVILFSADGSPVTVANITIESGSAALTNLLVVTTDDVSVGTLDIRVPLRGTSSVYVDGNIATFRLNNVTATGGFGAGGDIATTVIGAPGTTANPAPANTLQLSARSFNTLTVNGDFGTGATHRIDALFAGTITINGSHRGIVSVTRDITNFTVNGGIVNGRVRAGGSIGAIKATSATFARVSAAGNINSIAINGNVIDSPFLAGVDLGTDGTFDGAGAAADTVSAGNIGTVSIRGNFQRSDVGAGVLRGADGFLNTGDDLVADGRSTIGTVSITGTLVGSNSGSQRYAIISTGGNGLARSGNRVIAADNLGNFGSVVTTVGNNPLVVTDLRVFQQGENRYRARISFNQGVTESTVAAALSISHVRLINGVETLINLTQTVDYTFRYDAPSRSILIDFAQSIIEADLVQDTPSDTVPGPGIFRFNLDAGALRGQTANTGLDGNSDGIFTGITDDYSVDELVGDAGDRIFSGTGNSLDGTLVPFYGPVSLDALLDDNRSSGDGIADTNRLYTVRGFAGDHPNRNPTFFDSGSDVDVYTISLRAGQILRLGAMQGEALGLGRALITFDDQALVDNQGNAASSAQLQQLANPDPSSTDTAYLVTVTGVYNIVLLPNVADLLEFNPFGAFAASDPTTVTNNQPGQGTSGNYAFTVQIFDDGDSGFYAANAVSTAAPAALATRDDFAGDDMIYGTDDDLLVVSLPDVNPANPNFIYQLYLGADGQFDTADDEFRGSNGVGFYVAQTAGVDGQIGTADDVQTISNNNLTTPAPVDPDGAGPLLAVPVPQDFAGVDNTLGTIDDLRTVTRTSTRGGDFTFRLFAGPNFDFNSADAIVRGTNGAGITVSRSSGADGLFGGGDDLLRNSNDAGDGA
ncbi:MAG: beta strand repeat-containing protein, partial [Phycisphaerales bacterium]